MSLLNGITAVHVACLFILEKIRLKRRGREGSVNSTATVDEEKLAQRQRSDGAADEGVPGAGTNKADTAEAVKPKETPIDIVLSPMRWVAWWIVLCE